MLQSARPACVILGMQNDRHPVVNGPDHFIWRAGQHGKRPMLLALGVAKTIPDRGKREWLPLFMAMA